MTTDKTSERLADAANHVQNALFMLRHIQSEKAAFNPRLLAVAITQLEIAGYCVDAASDSEPP